MDRIKLTYDEVLTEASEYFGMRGISITGEGFREVATDPALLEEYIEMLLDGIEDAGRREQMRQLLFNANNTILAEASINGITPIASLSMPVIRKLWPKFNLKDALYTEVAKTPRFAITYQRPYMFRSDRPNEKIYLPDDSFDRVEGRRKDPLMREKVSVLIDTTTGETSASLRDQLKGQPLDKDVKIMIGADGGNGFVAEYTYKVMPINGSAHIVHEGVHYFVAVDFETGDVTVATVGDSPKQVLVEGFISEEFNEYGWSVSFDVERKDIEIPTGQHINAPMPIEWIQDNRALYNIDATKEVIDLMTNIVSQKLDIEVLEFLNAEYAKVADKLDPYGEPKFERVFDLRPAAGYAHTTQSWREELKPIIDDLAIMIKDSTYFNEGKFSIIGHPRDIYLINNIYWYRADEENGTNRVDGVDVEYVRGTYKGVYNYEIFSSLNCQQGEITIIFTPTTKLQMTYKYYPYTFNVEYKYLDPNRPHVPSVMMTKRHTFASHTPAIGKIYILNNDGRSMYKSTVDIEGGWGRV